MRLPRLRGRGAAAPPPGPAAPPLQPIKLRAIDAAFAHLGEDASVADLGGVWAVEAGYLFHALDAHAPRAAVLVDEDITPGVRARARAHPRLELVEANFAGGGAVRDVDLALLFDVLLHQVDPDWDAVLARWAPHVRAFAVVEPLLDGDDAHAVRLPELGRERYLELVPPDPLHDALFDRLDEPNPRRGGRPWRDVHDVWQWGITDGALRARMAELGFAEVHHEDGGPWQGLASFHHGAFVFARG
jgi:hypothetical protein